MTRRSASHGLKSATIAAGTGKGDCVFLYPANERIPNPFQLIDLSSFKNLQLRGGFRIVRLEITSDPLIDAIGRQAIARTTIIGREFNIMIRGGLTEEELSVTLYHEILESSDDRIRRSASWRENV